MVRTSKAFVVVAACLTFTSWHTASAATKNVVLLIADGAGYNTRIATSMYQGRWNAAEGKSTQVYDGPGWLALACSTYPLTTSLVPTGQGQQSADRVYDPVRAWDATRGYAWLKSTYTDSAAAATALSTGRKTYNNGINWSDLKQPIRPTLSEAAKAAGKSVGVITTVQWSHATPAGLSNAHNVDRDNYAEIAQEMLDGGVLDVIMGAGHPDFANNGETVRGKKEYKYVGGESVWRAIEQARATPGGTYKGFRPVCTKSEFEALTTGSTPAKVLGIAQVATTLQQARRVKNAADPAQDASLNANVPTLATMTKAALNVLDDDPDGLFLMIEGGAVDWANHNNQAGRMIQEQVDFLAAVEVVVDWVSRQSNWEEMLVVITADHETGLLWGPKSDEVPFDPIVDRGTGMELCQNNLTVS